MEYGQEYTRNWESAAEIANQWARDGWRLHTVVPGVNGLLLIFEREMAVA